MAQDAQKDAAGRMLGPGMVRRIRRILDRSQRELAQQLGVSHATLARWETGTVSPDLATVMRMADLAGLRLALVDADGAPVEPMADDALRDRAGRRFPAHLDGRDLGLVPIRFLHRGVYRDLFRRHLGTPPDHPPPGARRGY